MMAFLVLYLVWAMFVRPLSIQVAAYYWWMRP
jgi:hypothetical protein